MRPDVRRPIFILKHQEVLAEVYNKVPDEAKKAIEKAIETSRKGQEEATKQIAELKGEVEQLKKEVAELKTKDEEREKVIEELSNQKQKITPTPAPIKPSTPKTSETTPTPATPATPATPTSGGGGGGASSGPHPVTPLKCSDYKNYFAFILDCASISQSAFKDGVEIEPPLYTLCKQCLPADTSLRLIISNIQIANITENSVTITWVTNELANSEIFYANSPLDPIAPGPFTSPHTTRVIDSADTINHSLNLNNLTKGTVYYYEVHSVSANGHSALRSEQSFTTLASPSPTLTP